MSVSPRQLFLLLTVLLFTMITGTRAQDGRPTATAQKESSQPLTKLKKAVPPPAADTTAEPREEEEGEADAPRAREKWFYERRAYPNKTIPAGARLKALDQVKEMKAAEAAERERSGAGQTAPSAIERFSAAAGGPQTIPANTMTWTPIGPRPISTQFTEGNVAGRVSAVAVDPTNSSIVYIGGAQGGVWKTTNGGQNWTPLTDGQPTLAIGAIAIDPNSCNPAPCTTIYVGTGEATFSGDSYYGMGILKSMDGGNSWVQFPGVITNPQPGGPTQFVGPFSDVFSPGGGARISSIAVQQGNGNVLLAGVVLFQRVDAGLSSGIYRSADGGVNWTQVKAGAAGTEVFFDPTNASIAYAALGSVVADTDNGVYKSIDGGVTWTRADAAGTSKLPTTNVGRIEIAIAPSNPQFLYAGIANISSSGTLFGTLLGFFKSTDGGVNWTTLSSTPDYCTPQCDYDHVIKVHPQNGNVVFVGGSRGTNRFIQTTNGGTSWTPVASTAGGTLHADTQSMAFSNPASGTLKLFVGTDGGVWSSDLPTQTSSPNWNNLNADLQLTQFYPGISIDPGNLDRTFGGSQDNGTANYSGALTWTDTNACGDGGWTAIDPALTSNVYAACQHITTSTQYLLKSTGGGSTNSFATAQVGITNADRSDFIPPLIIDSNTGNSNRLYFGTFKLYQTMNNATSWTAMQGAVDLTSGGNAVIETMAIVPGNSDMLYVGSGPDTSVSACSPSRIQRSLNAGSGTAATFTDITGTGLPPRFITMLAVDPFDATGNTVYATFTGFAGSGSNFCDTRGHVFKAVVNPASPGTTAWTDISGNLPNTPVNDILVDPMVPNTLIIATDVGVFISNNAGASWSTLLSGLPTVAVFGLKLHSATRTLRAGTHGRGMWDLVLTNFNATFNISSISPMSAAVGDPGFNLTVNGVGFSPSSEVHWNGSLRPTTVVSPTQLMAAIPASDLTTGGSEQVMVFDPGQPAPGTTNFLTFSVNNPAPTLNNISPTSQPILGSPGFTLTANGSSFVSNSVVQWNGSPRTTTFVTSTQLTAAIPASDLTTPAQVNVTVQNPAPGGGTSAPQSFIVGTPPPNDNFANATVVTSTPFTNTVNNAPATVEAGEPSPPTIGGCPFVIAASNAHSVWYRFTPAANGTVNLDTIGSAYDTVLSVWTGTSFANLAAVACDDDGAAPAGGGPSQLTNLSITGGTIYFVMVSGFDSTQSGVTKFDLAATIPAPAITSLAPSSALTGGANFNLTVNGTGFSTTSTVMWNGAARTTTFGSATQLTAAIPATDIAAQGTAMVTVVNTGLGGATSSAANFTIGNVTVSSNPASATVTRGASALYNLSINFASMPSSAVMLACTGLPNLSACTFNPASPAPGPNPIVSTLTISTTAPSLMLPPAAWRMPPALPLYMLWVSVTALGITLLLARRMATLRGTKLRPASVLILALAVGMSVALIACGGGGGGSSGPTNPGTTPGTYTVTVTATSGAVSGSTSVTLTVQ